MSPEVDEYFANQRSYTEMLAEAQKIHPDMKVRLVGSSEWEMYMPTSYTEKDGLDERFRGTYAWQMSENPDYSYGSELDRYRWKQGHSDCPIDYVAELVNLKHEQDEWLGPVRERMFTEAGAGALLEDWPVDLSDEDFQLYKRLQHEAVTAAQVEFAPKWEAFNEKWKR